MPTAYGAPVAPPEPPDTLGDTSPTPEPPKPAGARRAASHGRLQKLFGSPDDFYSVFGENQAAIMREQTASDPALRQSVAITAFLADRLNLSGQDVSARYDTLRTDYARQMFPDRLAADGTMDDGVFFTNASRLLSEEKAYGEQAAEWNATLFEQAASGKDFATAVDAIRSTGTLPSGGKADAANAWLINQWEANRTTVAKLSPIIAETADLFTAMRTKEGVGTDDFVTQRTRVLDRLMSLGAQERAQVLAMAGRRAQEGSQQSERGAVGKTFGALSEATDDLISSALVGLANTAEAVAPAAMIPVALDKERAELERTMTRLVSGEIDPIKGDTFAGEIALQFTRSVPMMMAALTPAGLAVDYFALKQNARDNLEAQGITGRKAEAVATAQAIPQTALFFATSKMVFLGATPKAFGTSIPATLATEYLGNLALNEAGFLTDAGIQQIAAQLTTGVPDVDWQQFGAEFEGRLPQSLALAIPGALIGTGVATFKNRAAGTKYLQDPAVMDELGFTPEAKAAVVEAPNYEAAEQAFKDGYTERTPPAGAEPLPAPTKQLPDDTQFSVQVPERFGKAKIPGFVQVDLFEPGVEGAGVVSGGNRRNTRSTNILALRAEGFDIPEIPRDLPKGKYTLAQLREEVAKRPTGHAVYQLGEGGVIPFEEDPAIVRNPDSTYTVRAVEGAPAATAASPEGAAMVAEAQHTEAAQQASTAAPEPRPEADGNPLAPRITALNKEAIAALRSVFSMDVLPPPQRERFLQVLDEAKRTESHKNALAIANDLIATRRVSTASEHAALVLRSAELQNHYETKLREVADAAATGDTEGAARLRQVADGYLAELDTLTEASDVTGTEIARALSIRRMRLNRDDYTLARVIQRASEAKRDKLTPQQQDALKAITDDLIVQQQTIAEQKNQLRAQEIEIARANAETFVSEGRSRRRRAAAADATQRRKALKGELLALGMRVNDITSLVGLSFEQARIVAKIADTYIEEGVASLAELTNKLKADIPDLSDQDIFVAVGRQTKKEAAKIEAEAKRRVKELRAQAGLWAKINAALDGKRADGSPMNRKQQNKLLRETLAQLRRQAARTVFNDAALARVDAKIREIQDHLAKGTRPAAEPAAPAEGAGLAAARQTLNELRQEMGAVDTIAELERALADAQPEPGNAGKPAPKPSPTEQQAKLNALRERMAELRDQIDQAQLDPAAVNAERLARLQKLTAELETQLEEGFRPIPEQRGAIPETDPVQAARKQVRELERLMRTSDSIADLENQIRTGDFKVSAPERRLLANAKLEQALIRERQLKRQIDELIEDVRTKTVGERIFQGLNEARALTLTADLGTLVRQLGLLSSRAIFSAERALLVTKTIRAGLQSLKDADAADAMQIAMENRPNYLEGQRSGLFLSDLGGPLLGREEAFQGRLAERIPLWGRVIRASNRFTVASLNAMRAGTFDAFMKHHPESTPEQRKAYARYVNEATGRGTLKMTGTTAKVLTTLFLAPRFTVSRFQTLWSPFRNWKDPTVRNEILKDFAAYATTGTTILTLASLAGLEVGLDPSESDFGKIVTEDGTRFDIWGGLQQPVRLLLQAALAGPQRGEVVELEREIQLKEAGLNFLWYKTSPAVQIPYTLVTGENAIGQEQSVGETIYRSVTPLSISETIDVFDETESIGAALVGAGANLIGIGVQQHENR